MLKLEIYCDDHSSLSDLDNRKFRWQNINSFFTWRRPRRRRRRCLSSLIQNGLDHVLRKEQAGFRKNKNIIDQIFILRNIIEQVNEWQATFYAHFVHFEKAFDSVHLVGLWRIMKAYSIPDKLIRLVKIMYDYFECSVLEEREQTRWFKITTGVKQ